MFQHPTVDDLYIALGDRWLPERPAEKSNMTELFRKAFDDARSPSGDASPSGGGLPEANTSIADYVWLPIPFDEDDRPVIEWHDEWRIDA